MILSYHTEEKMMNSRKIIKYLQYIIERATEVDENGVEYYKDIELSACDIEELSAIRNELIKEQQTDKTQKLWEIYKELSLGNSSYTAQVSKELAKNIVEGFFEP